MLPPSPPIEPIVGIDLGTTNSLVAIADAPGARVLTDAHGRSIVPSVVRYEHRPNAPGSLIAIVGEPARDAIALHPRATIASVKRLMGRSLRDAAPDLPFLSSHVVEGANQTVRLVVNPVGAPPDDPSREVSPQEVSAAILRELRRVAEHALGHPVHRAVITVPAYFDDAQRQATRDAGRLAGLDVVRIVNEPTAAALAYGLGSMPAGSPARTIAVYDLGGGTFDISILRVTPPPPHAPGEIAFFQVLSTSGDTHLGGDDIDQLLVGHLTSTLTSLGTPLPTTNAAARAILKAGAERLKIALSEHDVAEISITLPGAGDHRFQVSRAEFEGLIEPLVARTLECCARALRDANLAEGGATQTLDALVMVGGSTRIPLVRRRAGEFFGAPPYVVIDPDRAVALGAALQAGILSGHTTGALLLDVIPLSLGIETAGGAVSKIIIRNSTVPARAREMFSTQVDGQTSIKLHILQGEREMVEHARSLGIFHLRGIPPMPAGIPQVEVEFLVDSSGVLHVSATERRSGKRADLQVVPNHGLSREEVDRMEKESIAHAREDMTRHRVVDLVAHARLDLRWIAERLSVHGALLKPAYLATLQALAADLRSLVDRADHDWRSVDPEAFYKAKEALDQASVRLQEVSITESLRHPSA